MKRVEGNVYLERFEVNVRPYLSMAEIELIAQAMMKGKNYAEEIALRDALLIQLCTDISEEDAKDYEYIVKSGLMENIIMSINNAYYIQEFVDHARSVSVATVKFLETLTKNLDKYSKKLPNSKQLENLVKEIKEIKII